MSLTKTKKLLAERIQKNQKEILEWHAAQAKIAPPPIYCSIDLRDSGHKIVPVDSNLYPAGFNNICPEDVRTAPAIIRAELETLSQAAGQGQPSRILVIPESHTTNTFYIENLCSLFQLLQAAGFETRLGWYGTLPEGATAPLSLKSASEKTLQAYPIEVQDGVISAGGFVPDLVLLNNDFSSGYPKLLDGIRQPILPSHRLGWHTRKKSDHFVHYNRLASEFARMIDIDPWLIQIETEEVDQVNFNEDQGVDRVAETVGRVLEKTRLAYATHKIAREPFAFVKNNSGTYGMGIMVVHSADELLHLNRRAKNKMSTGKNRLPIGSVVVQEGVPTATLVDRLPAEPVIYLCGAQLIGGFLRTNTERGEEDNLNSQGMVFRKLCMSDLRTMETDPGDESLRGKPLMEMVYGSIARISALATGLELKAKAAFT